MSESFLSLPISDQAILIRQQAPELNMLDLLVEKDIWICWALEKLFAMPDQLPMGFKGGTSLSKAYNAIDRFSEDIDITLDYKAFGESIRGDESRTEIDKLNDRLKGVVLEHTRDIIKPYFENVLSELSSKRKGKVELDETGEKLYVYYPSVLGEDSNRYVPTSVLLEFGGRNINEPNEQKKITPYISANLRDYKFPEPTVTVLAFMRTYWEKITLAHVECNRQKPRSDASRLSRHWYDIYKMSADLTESQIAGSFDLLADVVRHKKVFFNSSYANYDAVLTGGLRLVPGTEPAKVLESDFKAMIEAGMFYSDPPPFKAILARLGEVEHSLNKTISTRGRHI